MQAKRKNKILATESTVYVTGDDHDNIDSVVLNKGINLLVLVKLQNIHKWIERKREIIMDKSDFLVVWKIIQNTQYYLPGDDKVSGCELAVIIGISGDNLTGIGQL
jgi:hypothetical protein